MRDFSTLGAKLGPKLATLVSQSVIATKRALGPHEIHVRRRATQDVIDQAGREVADHYRPLVRALLDAEGVELHPDVRGFLEEAVSGEHQLKALGGLLTGGVSGTIGTLLSDLTAPAIYQLVRQYPLLNLDTGTLASLAAAGLMSDADAANRAAEQGISNTQFERLKLAAETVPTVSELQDMSNRGVIDEGTARAWMQRNGIAPEAIDRLLRLRFTLLPPDLAALAVLRGVISAAEGEAIALQSGVPPRDFAIMVADTGEPLGLQELLEARRRGFIDKATLERGIRQSRVRNEWIPTAEALAFSPMSVADAVTAVVQSYFTPAQAASIAEQNGLEAGAVDTLIKTAGEPLSRTELEQLYNRGLIDRAVVEQGLRESRLKNKYITDAFNLHVKLLEPRMLASAVEFGAITHDAAIKHAMAQGYSEADATVLIGEGSARKLFSFKNRVITAAESLYEVSGMSEAAFGQTIQKLGFSAEEASFIIQAANFRKKERQIATTVNAVRSKFIAHHLNENQASAILDKSGLLAAQRDQLIATWQTERSAVVRNLTEAQLIRALKKRTLTVQQVNDRLIQMGYTQVDAAILIADA